MPYSNIRKVANVQILDWEVEGEFHIDCYYPSLNYYVMVEDTNGERWVHECVFNDSAELDDEGFVFRSGSAKGDAEMLAKRVEARGTINLEHWGFHEYFSLSLEQRLNQEAEYEDMHRRGHGDQVPNSYWGGLA